MVKQMDYTARDVVAEKMVVDRRRSGWTFPEIAKALNITPQRVHQIWWRWVREHPDETQG